MTSALERTLTPRQILISALFYNFSHILLVDFVFFFCFLFRFYDKQASTRFSRGILLVKILNKTIVMRHFNANARVRVGS